ncbi:MAG TPA: type II secretion system protein GspM [Gemmatimonadaceae bacterium]|nr:type II secretion system protein GspM [Gemmatimonadaceae bacterium]
MKMISLSPRDRRALSLGGAVLALLLLVARGLPAWSAWATSQRAIADQLAAQVARARSDVRSSAPTHDSLVMRGKRMVALAPRILAGESPASAVATLGGVLSGAAATAGVQVGAVQMSVDSSATSAFSRVRVRASATGDIAGVTELLRELEQGPTLLSVRELNLSQPEPAAPASQPEALRIELVVEGLALNRQSRGASR